jgi:hypothetical protein
MFFFLSTKKAHLEAILGDTLTQFTRHQPNQLLTLTA